MGALIRTMGTKLLIGLFNNEFSTYIGFYRQSQNMQFFDTSSTSYTDLLHATNSIADTGDVIHAPRSDHLTLLPYLPASRAGGVQQHPNLESRWKWFLTTGNASAGSLTQTNHNKIAVAIYTALNDSTFNSITFDAVEGFGSQDVSATVAYDEGPTKYMQIVLYTSAMPLGTPGSTNPPPIDSAPGYVSP
jgi:hypothetical protein